jgi:DNA-binding response OmpR family regulator
MNGEQVKTLVGEQSFDALIVNGRMSGGWSAPEVYRWICETHPGREKHLLFTFSSVVEPEMRTFLQENGIPHLVKPFEVGDLIAQARRLLHKTQAAVAG